MPHHLNYSPFSEVSGKLSNQAFNRDTGTDETTFNEGSDLDFFPPHLFTNDLNVSIKEVGGAGVRCAGLGALQFRLSAPGSTYPHTSDLLSGSAASYLTVSPGAAWARNLFVGPAQSVISLCSHTDTCTKCSLYLTTVLHFFNNTAVTNRIL